jgi:hypothetical protein
MFNKSKFPKYFADYSKDQLMTYYEDVHKVEQAIKDLLSSLEDKHQAIIIKKVNIERRRFKVVGVQLIK